jgi:hypothetical protein
LRRDQELGFLNAQARIPDHLVEMQTRKQELKVPVPRNGE